MAAVALPRTAGRFDGRDIGGQRDDAAAVEHRQQAEPVDADIGPVGVDAVQVELGPAEAGRLCRPRRCQEVGNVAAQLVPAPDGKSPRASLGSGLRVINAEAILAIGWVGVVRRRMAPVSIFWPEFSSECARKAHLSSMRIPGYFART